jgi:Family of unknown function (DUF6325)
VSIGPVEYIAIAFPGNKFSGEIIPALEELVTNGTIKILDLVLIHKDGAGNVDAVEAADAGPEEAATLAVLGIEGRHLLGQEDIEDIGDALDANSSCALMIWENVWAERFATSLRNADGVLIANGRIPAPIIEEVMAEATVA